MIWTADDIKARLIDRDMQLWGVRKGTETLGAVVTETYDTAAGRVCAIPITGGDRLAEWLHLLPVIEEWAKRVGCVRIEATGRSGWERALRRQGYRAITTQVGKEL